MKSIRGEFAPRFRLEGNPSDRLQLKGDVIFKALAIEAPEIFTASLAPGDLIGEMGLLERQPRNADVIATSPMRVIKLTHWEIRRMSQQTVERIAQIIEARRQAGLADPGDPSANGQAQ